MKRKVLFHNSPFKRAMLILNSRDRRKVTVLAVVQVLVGLMDLIGILLVGLLVTITLPTGEQKSVPAYAFRLLGIFGFESADKKGVILFISLLAVFFLTGRTLISLIITKKIIYFLSIKGAEISSELIARLLSKPITFLKVKNSQDNLYALTRGVEYITVYVIATSIVLIADTSILLILSGMLFIIAPETMIVVAVTFTAILIFLHHKITTRASSLGSSAAQLSITSNNKILEVFSTFREATVQNRRSYYAKLIRIQRLRLANEMSELHFMPYASKYIIEGGVIITALLVGGIQFFVSSSSEAIGTLVLFLAAGSRIGPAALRIQQGIIQISSGLGMSDKTLDLVETLQDDTLKNEVTQNQFPDRIYSGFRGNVLLRNLSYRYPDNLVRSIEDVTVEFNEGAVVVIVGRSGVGKSTLADLILGIIEPEQGVVQVSGLKPEEAINKWPGAIAYVPQQVYLVEGTIAENVTLGRDSETIDTKQIEKVLRIAQLDSWIKSLPAGISTPIGEGGYKLSGGQKQRLGIARALVTEPKLLVLDEATSALDSETELELSKALEEIRGKTTVVLIAHRLSLARNADLVIFMDNGVIECSGTFNEVRNQNSDFDNQAKLMGL